MIEFDDYRMFSVHSEYTDASVRCYHISVVGKTVTSLLLAGPEQQVVCAFSNMVQGACTIAYNGQVLNRDECRYRRLVTPIQPTSLKWMSALVLSKDKKIIWQDHDAGLIDGLKRLTHTPFLDSWIHYIRAQLVARDLLVKMQGKHPFGSYLSCNTEDLDDIVCTGLKSGAINIKGAVQWYVIDDGEGPWLTDKLSGGKVIAGPLPLFEAECALNREISMR